MGQGRPWPWLWHGEGGRRRATGAVWSCRSSTAAVVMEELQQDPTAPAAGWWATAGVGARRVAAETKTVEGDALRRRRRVARSKKKARYLCPFSRHPSFTLNNQQAKVIFCCTGRLRSRYQHHIVQAGDGTLVEHHISKLKINAVLKENVYNFLKQNSL